MVFAFLGPTEVIIILVVALLVFGPQKLPEIGKQIGSAYRELNKMRSEVTRALEFDSYVQPYDMPPYEPPADGTTYARNGYGSDTYHDYNALHTALAVPPPGPTVGANVTLRPVDENAVIDVPAPLEASSAAVHAEEATTPEAPTAAAPAGTLAESKAA